MQFERFSIQACCGKKAIIFKIGQPITEKTILQLVAQGYKEHTHFTKAGILYADNLDFIVTGPIGSDKLQVKCKKGSCDQKLNDFEALLAQLE
jgi:hypothetical protein